MKATPPITVIMPIKNVEEYVAGATNSILNQTFGDFRFLIIDDHSDDNTFDIVFELAKQDVRIELIKSGTAGFVNSLNQGISMNESPFVARMDGDDIATKTRFAKQLTFLQENPDIHVCGSWIRLFGEKNETWHYREYDEHIKNLMVFKRSGFGHNAVMLRKEVYDEIQYELEFEYCEDYRLWSKIAARTHFKFHNLQEVLMDYRIHNSQTIATKQNIQYKLRERILRDFLTDLDVTFNENEFRLFEKLRNLQDEYSAHDRAALTGFISRLKLATARRFPDIFNVYDNMLTERGFTLKGIEL